MSKNKKRKYKLRDNASSQTGKTTSFLCSQQAYDMLVINGYTKLDEIPAIVSGCRKIAELIGSMTIHLMANTKDGDQRIENELSRQFDIHPSKRMNRSQWMEMIVMNMLLYGSGNAIVRPITKNGYIDDLQIVPTGRFSINQDVTGYDYTISIDGVTYNPDDILHFVYNPDKQFPWKGKGITSSLKEVADCLKQAQTTEHAYMKSNWRPSLIIKADGMVDTFATKEGRKKLLSEFVEMDDIGSPWVIPADQIDVKEVRPLSLSDIALNDSVELDTKKVASLLGVPPFVLGVGTYNQKEWNNFVQQKIRPLAISIQQEMTRKLIYKKEWYLRFNFLSLLDYDISTVASVYTQLQDRGDVNGNEVRDKIGLSPVDGLNEYKVLENYIPVDMTGMQKKLVQSKGAEDD